MNKIKFSHEYCKMPIPLPPKEHIDHAKLLEVFISDKKELHESFINYDTRIKTDYRKKEYYPLPNGKLIILLLCTDVEIWTTIRRWTPEKEKYYRSIRGQNVEIVIE